MNITLKISLVGLALTAIGCSSVSEEIPATKIPIPTQVVDHMANEKDFEESREAYFDGMHRAAPGTDWKAMNKRNLLDKVHELAGVQKMASSSTFANGRLTAQWKEKGSKNQAGNVRVADYDVQSDMIYAISDGGVLWKGPIDGSSWTPLNDHAVFSPDAIETFRLSNGTLRIMAARGSSLWYSDDEGLTWTEVTGITTSEEAGSAVAIKKHTDASGTIAYCYVAYDSFSGGYRGKLAYSADEGATFTGIKTFDASDDNFISMCTPEDESTSYVLDRSSKVFSYSEGAVTTLTTASGISAGNTSMMVVSSGNGQLTFYALGDDNNLFKSVGAPTSFSFLSQLPTNTWEVGIGVSIDDPDVVYYGEMELYRSENGGVDFEKTVEWWRYYDDVEGSIHADIMAIQSFKNGAGQEFTLVPNHGGLSITYDKMQSTTNIGMDGLNVGQFYDVLTDPNNSNYIYVGTQDQGWLRASNATTDGPVDMEQVVSGDYGHMQLTSSGAALWTQYPGGDFNYYSYAPTDASSEFWWNMPGTMLPNSGWMLATAPSMFPSEDYIFVGGGNLDGTSGSYLIKLEPRFNGAAGIEPMQYEFDFWAEGQGNITAIETSIKPPGYMYVGLSNGGFFWSTDAGTTWNESSDFAGPGGHWLYGADILASNDSAGHVYFSGSGYSNAPVWKSTDGGQNFFEVSNGLPSTMVRELVFYNNEEYIFAATDAGPYVYVAAEDMWYDITGDAPIQEYTSVEYVEAENLIRFGTWGRGIWDFHIESGGVGLEEIVETNGGVYPNPAKNIVSVKGDWKAETQVFDLSGKLVLTSTERSIDVSELPRGVYVFKNGTESKKVVLQ